MIKTQDRISYSYGFKVPGRAAYSSVNVSVSLSTDVREGETLEQAMARAKAFVHDEADRESAAAPPANVDDETFDSNNPVHYRLACEVFAQENVTSEKARAFKLQHLLDGARVGDIGAIVRKDQEEFKKVRSQPFRVKQNGGTKSNWNGQWRNQ